MSDMTHTTVPFDACGSSAEPIDVGTHESNTYRVATQKYVNDSLSEHDASSFAHSGLLDGFIRSVNGNEFSGGAAEVSSIRILGDGGTPRFELFADGTVVFDGVTSRVALVDGGSGEERGIVAYSILKACSAGWEDASLVTEGTSARNERTADAVEVLSGYWSSAAALTVATSARNEASCSFTSRLSPKVPSAVWNAGNSVADMETVRKAVKDTASNYRGTWTSWSEVPTDSSLYLEDHTGSKVPVKNDTIVVSDASELSYCSDVNASIVGCILKNPEEGLPAGHMLTAEDVEFLVSKKKYRIVLVRNGMWRFRYVGTWTEGAAGKSRWTAESKISNISLTEGQIATLDSGLTVDDKIRYDSTVSGFAGLSSTVAACSSNWDSVSGKLDLSSINYFTEAVWDVLTRYDTYYGDVPYGFSLIYEEATPEKADAYYRVETGELYLSENVAYFDGELTMSPLDTFDLTSGTYTMCGSSIATGMFRITNNLTHAINTCSISVIASGESYAPNVMAEDGYYLLSLGCTMGGVAVKLRDNKIDIPSVSGDIVVTAVGSPAGGPASYYASSGLLMLPSGTNYATESGKLEFTTSVTFSGGEMLINGTKYA